MSKSLKDNLTSDWIGASHLLYSKKTRRKIVAYVESFDDIAFWRTLFQAYETDAYYFHVMLPSNHSLTKGKKAVLMHVVKETALGINMVACVDSDYDYLLQGASSVSKLLLTSPYVFHTYAYAIDNYLCYAPSMQSLCVQVTLNDRHIINFESFMQEYSKIVYPLFVFGVWLQRNHELSSLTINDFVYYTGLKRVRVYHLEQCLNDVKKRTGMKLRKLRNKYPQIIETDLPRLEKELAELGVTPETTYMFIQGHHLVDNVVMRLLKPICAILRRERENEISEFAEHEEQFQNELSSYTNSTSTVEMMLRKNTNYTKSPLYQRIQKDVAAFLERTKEI
ncbi:MAG: DUF4435 domain-containing protein [Bacteroidaceae bacterium]|nr:DUF4435 domain-containing protein [Bacteroidaceae bacterium]